MPIESARDFDAFVDSTTGHGVTGTYFQSGKLFDAFPLIDTLGLIDDGASVIINLIIDLEYINLEGGTVSVEGFQPTAIVKSSVVDSFVQNDTVKIDAITTNKGNTLTAETSFLIKTVESDNTGFVQLKLEKI